ncbi:unnamed protein product [Leptidea sinapis]|uniref:EF-hand domain-containing protein n=1 Tax=Leptidea sinapis TaxID=189913 RepID=A0A5E4R738_9NEOP|nr:unnamed protein product [Leptidea sinapis]
MRGVRLFLNAGRSAAEKGSPPKPRPRVKPVIPGTKLLKEQMNILLKATSTWDRGTNSGEGSLKFEPWAKGLSVILKGTLEEKRTFCFRVYDLNSDGFITKDEMFILLKNSLLKQPGDEDPDEGVRDLVELVLRKLDVDKDGKVSMDDYRGIGSSQTDRQQKC